MNLKKLLENQNYIGGIIIGTVICLVLGILILLYYLQKTHIEVDSSYCPVDKSIKYNSTLVLIDKTDPMTSSQKKYLLGYTEDLMRSFSLFEKVIIYQIDSENAVTPMPLFERCNPGSPDEANVWIENLEQIRETFESGFSGPFNKAIDESIAAATANESPILETIQTVTSCVRLDEKITRQKLVLISDMLQNVEEYSQYGRNYSYSSYINTDYARRMRSNLLGVGVTIVYLWRPSLSPDDVDKHLLFWGNYIRDNGGVLEHVYKVK